MIEVFTHTHTHYLDVAVPEYSRSSLSRGVCRTQRKSIIQIKIDESKSKERFRSISKINQKHRINARCSEADIHVNLIV